MGVSTRKQKETEALREQVLDTAEDIFVREGIEQVTMRRIAASIDYAPTVLYRLFANKADLTDHLIARGYNGVRDQYDAVLSKKIWDQERCLKKSLQFTSTTPCLIPITTECGSTPARYASREINCA